MEVFVFVKFVILRDEFAERAIRWGYWQSAVGWHIGYIHMLPRLNSILDDAYKFSALPKLLFVFFIICSIFLTGCLCCMAVTLVRLHNI